MSSFTAYKKDMAHTYILGAFPTIEALEMTPELFLHVYIHPDYYESDALIDRLKEKNIPYDISGRSIRRLAKKDNTLVVGVVKKELPPVTDDHHVVLENISNMGNLGTIIRTMVGMGVTNLVTVGNVADIYHPNTIRASMGAFFKINHSHFETMKAYQQAFAINRKSYFFLLNEQAVRLNHVEKPNIDAGEKFSLIFGNEGAGLESEYGQFGTAVFIPQTDAVDSLNLPISVAIGLYEFIN